MSKRKWKSQRGNKEIFQRESEPKTKWQYTRVILTDFSNVISFSDTVGNNIKMMMAYWTHISSSTTNIQHLKSLRLTVWKMI